jgi:hypothetical protein
MSCSSDSTKNTDIKAATFNSLNSLYKYTNSNVFKPDNINVPFNNDFINTFKDNINTNLDELDDNKNDLFIRNEITSNIYQNCAIQANNPWFTTSSDYKKCEIIKNIELDNKLNLSADKTKVILNLKSKNSSKPAFSPYFFNINKAYCENKWYDWIITPNYYLGNTYYKDTSKYRDVDVYKCYKPCEKDFIPYKTEKGEHKCIPKKLFGNGIFSDKYIFSPIGLINLIGNILINENNDKNLIGLLYKSIIDYNLEKNIDTEIYFKNAKVYKDLEDKKNNIALSIHAEFKTCIDNHILNNFSNEKEQDYSYIKEFTYKNRKFNENEPEMYTLSGLDSCGVLIHPILHHTWILANIFKPVLEEDINYTSSISDENALKSDTKYKGSIHLFKELKRLFNDNDNDNKAMRLKNLFYKAVNICYDNKTNFSTNIINLTKKSLEYYKNNNQSIIYLPLLKDFYDTSITSDTIYSKYLYLTDNKPFFNEHKFYKDFEFNDLYIKYPGKSLLLGDVNNNNDNTRFKYFFSVEDLEIKSCEKGYFYNTRLQQCEKQAIIIKKENEEINDDIDDNFSIPKLQNIFFIFLQIILFILGIYIIYIFYDIFGETILTIYNFIYMKITEYHVYFNKMYGPSIIPRNYYNEKHEDNYNADLDYKLSTLQYENLKNNKLKIDEYINSHKLN